MKLSKIITLLISVVFIFSLASCTMSGEQGKSEEELVKEALMASEWLASETIGEYHAFVELMFEDTVYQTRVIINTQTISSVIHKYEIKDGKIICYTDNEYTEFSYTIENGKAILNMGPYKPS